MDKNKITKLLEGAERILNSQVHAIKNDKDYPIKDDLRLLGNVKEIISAVEKLLKK